MTTGPQNQEEPPQPEPGRSSESGQPDQPGQPTPPQRPAQPGSPGSAGPASPPPGGYQQPPPPTGYQQPPPPGGYQQAPPPAGYPTAPPMRQEDEKLWALGAHLGPLVLGFIAPLVVWLVFRERSAFLDHHGKEALNFQIAYLVYFVVAGVSIFALIGFILLPLVAIAWVVFMILAAVQASQYHEYRYPWIFRVIS